MVLEVTGIFTGKLSKSTQVCLKPLLVMQLVCFLYILDEKEQIKKLRL